MSDERPGRTRRAAVAWPVGMLLGLVVILVAVLGASHQDVQAGGVDRLSTIATHDHGLSCHEAGTHDSMTSAQRVDRSSPIGAVPVATTTPCLAPPAMPTGPVPPASSDRHRGGRAHLVLAQISRT